MKQSTVEFVRVWEINKQRVLKISSHYLEKLNTNIIIKKNIVYYYYYLSKNNYYFNLIESILTCLKTSIPLLKRNSVVPEDVSLQILITVPHLGCKYGWTLPNELYFLYSVLWFDAIWFYRYSTSQLITKGHQTADGTGDAAGFSLDFLHSGLWLAITLKQVFHLR